MEKEPTTQDILEAINHFATDVENQFAEVKTDIKILKQDVTSLKQDVTSLKQDVTSLKQDVTSLKHDVTGIKASMVTKSYLDDKMADLRGDSVSMLRKEDLKVDAFVKISADEGAISKKSAHKILAMGPFPK